MEPTQAAASARLVTAFGTVLYVDAPSGELRHGAVEHSPANAVLAGDRETLAQSGAGRLAHEAAGGRQPIGSNAEGTWLLAGSRAPAGLAAQPFDIEPLDGGALALRAAGIYLTAQADGRITRAAEACGAQERFRPLDGAVGSPVGGADAADTLAIFPGPTLTCYHLGCGPYFLPGYLNMDLREDVERGRVFQVANVEGAFFASVDLSGGLPGCDNSLDVIYHSHFLEHLTYVDAIRLLRHARLRLKPGGHMRLLVPDLELWIENYRRNNTAFFDAYRRYALGNNAALYHTKGAVFMGMLHNHGHRCGYDWETLDWLLRGIGFVNVRRTMFQESALPDIAVIEPYNVLRGMESLCVECQKSAAAPEPR